MTHIKFNSNIGIGFLGLSYQLGADYENPMTYGTSHLMEHMICKSYDHMRSTLTRLCIDNNAYTQSDKIVFWLEGLNEQVQEVAQEWCENITSGQFIATKEAFELEQKVVLEEYADAFNSQTTGGYYNTLRQYYDFYCAIGERRSIENFTYDDYVRNVEKFKRPTLLCQCGGDFVDLNGIEFVPQSINTTQLVLQHRNVQLEQYPRMDKIGVGLISKNGITDKFLVNKLNLLLTCLNGNLEAPLYELIREVHGLAYCSYGWFTSAKGNKILTFCAETTSNRSNELKTMYDGFFDGDLSRHISKQRFDDCKQFLLISKRKDELLPHEYAKKYGFDDDPWIGTGELTYEDALQLLQRYFHVSNFQAIEY